MYSKDLLATVDMRSYTVTFEKQSDFPSHSLVDTLTLHLLVHEDAQGRGTRNQGYLNYNCWELVLLQSKDCGRTNHVLTFYSKQRLRDALIGGRL